MVADFKSILIYFSALTLTLLLLRICYKTKIQSRLLIIFLIVITALPLSLIAGLRDYSVGTDSYNYIMIFNNANRKTFIACLTQTEYEKGFMLLLKFLMIFSKEVSFVFGSLEFITLIILFYSLIKIKEIINPCYIFFLYFLVFYHTSINIVRQGLAISLIFLMIIFLTEKNYIKSLVTLFIAINFHYSSIIAVLFLIPYLLFKNQKNLSLKRAFYYFAFILEFFVFSLFFGKIMNMSIFSSYSDYVGEDSQIGIGIFITGFLYFVPLLLLANKLIYSNREVSLIFNASLQFLPIAFLGYFAPYAARLNLYPKIIIILLISYITKNEFNKTNKRFLKYYYLSLFVFEYVKNFLIQNQTDAYPYIFKIFN